MNTTKKSFQHSTISGVENFSFCISTKNSERKKRSIQAALISKSGEKYVDNCFQQSTSNMLKTRRVQSQIFNSKHRKNDLKKQCKLNTPDTL